MSLGPVPGPVFVAVVMLDPELELANINETAIGEAGEQKAT